MSEPRPIPRQIAVVATLLLATSGAAEGSHAETLLGDPTAPWAIHLQIVDDALKTGDVTAALRAWHDAYLSALGSRRWEGMVEVGDAYLRVGRTSRIRGAAEAKARQTYLAAFVRARQQGALEGVLRVAGAFAALGDGEMVEQCLRVAGQLAGRDRDPEAHARVRAFAAQLEPSLAAGPPAR